MGFLLCDCSFLGKSTFAKQIKILYCGGFNDPEVYLFKEVYSLSHDFGDLANFQVILDNVSNSFCCLLDSLERIDKKVGLSHYLLPFLLTL
jgi:hypothetical protein